MFVCFFIFFKIIKYFLFLICGLEKYLNNNTFLYEKKATVD